VSCNDTPLAIEVLVDPGDPFVSPGYLVPALDNCGPLPRQQDRNISIHPHLPLDCLDLRVAQLPGFQLRELIRFGSDLPIPVTSV
jgi:hypothetical protein